MSIYVSLPTCPGATMGVLPELPYVYKFYGYPSEHADRLGAVIVPSRRRKRALPRGKQYAKISLCMHGCGGQEL